LNVAGHPQPAPAPRFNRSVPTLPEPGVQSGAHTREVLTSAGLSASETEYLIYEKVFY
jgi:alpha-methylacyl-CoA racemase